VWETYPPDQSCPKGSGPGAFFAFALEAMVESALSRATPVRLSVLGLRVTVNSEKCGHCLKRGSIDARHYNSSSSVYYLRPLPCRCCPFPFDLVGPGRAPKGFHAQAHIVGPLASDY
jgi:hypothetical protein